MDSACIDSSTDNGDETEAFDGCEWQCDINMSPDEEDLITRMHKLVGNRWSLIAGRIPGRTAEEVERYWKRRMESQETRRREILKPVCSRPQASYTPLSGCL